MSRENVEIVRHYFEASARFAEAYWKKPYSLAAAQAGELTPEGEEMQSYVHPEIEWTPAFSTQTYRGYLGTAKAWDEFLEAAESYTLKVKELIDLGGDRVIAVVDGAIKGKGSGVEVSANLCTLLTLRDGLILRAHDYLDLQDALEAVGLSDQDMSA
jgi:ketosteroid isomerase-like protein